MHRVERELVYAAVLLAVGILLPQVFHLLGGLGAVLLPMHLGILLGAYFLSVPWCLALGVLTPLASMVLSGMPAAPVSYAMAMELSVLGTSVALAHKKGFQERFSLILGIGFSRIARILATWVLSVVLGFSFNIQALLTALFVVGLPGLLLQLLLLPPLARRIRSVLKQA